MRIGQWDLGYDDFKNIPFIIPPKDEQAEIVEFIESGLSKYDTLIEKKTALLEEMETYKKSVIYEYVTGKKEVL
jgi:type I restriction enzyme S subunit